MGVAETTLTTVTTMAPVTFMAEHDEEPMSRTFQYRKVMKPLLERKRRARINSCLDVLELTVKHLRKLKRQQMLAVNPGLDMDRYRAGYTTCATEVSRCLASTGVDISIGSRLMSHLGHKLNTIETSRHEPLTVRVPEPRKLASITSPVSDQGYGSGRDQTPSPRSSASLSPSIEDKNVWRPF